MRLELIKELFLFFARFPSKEGVLELFSQGKSEIPLYEEWKEAVNQLPDEALFPEVKHYIFGSNPRAVAERINAINSCFMFVDYGHISGDKGNIGQREDSFTILITIAYPNKKGKADLIEMANYSEMSLNLMSRLRNQLYNEEKRIPWLKQAMSDHELAAWESDTMPSTGWTLMMERKQADMLRMKDKQKP